MNPIPARLAALPWYAPHLAYLASQGLTPRHDPGGAEPKRADLAGADLAGADLTGADLTGPTWRWPTCGGLISTGPSCPAPT